MYQIWATQMQTNIHFKMDEYLKMQLTFHTTIDNNSSSKMQFRQLTGMDVNYNFHEKMTN
jgi:hypothetical protein